MARLKRFYNLSMWLLVGIPFAIILSGGATGPITVVAFIAAMIGGALFAPALKQIPEWGWNIGLIGVIAASALSLLPEESSVVDVGIHLVIYLLIVRLLSRFSPREDLQLIALSFLLLTASTLVQEGVVFGVAFFFYVVVGTFCLALFHFDSEISERARREEIDASLNVQFFGALGIIAAFILAGSVVIFFAFPRIGLGFFAQQKRDATAVAGFSDSVELGQHGAIRDNPEVVLRIEMENGVPEMLTNAHWRALSFDTYDGRKWTRTKDDKLVHIRRRDGAFDLREHQPINGAETLRLSMYLEPLGDNVLPTLWPTSKIYLGIKDTRVRWGPSHGRIALDSVGDVRHTIANEIGVQYRISVTAPPERTAVEFPLPSPPKELERYLQQPPMSQEFRVFARGLVKNNQTLAQNVDAIVAHMESNYTYTTDLPPGGENPVQTFLFETKRGHCEYFATTTVLILRENGIPARLVNGFLGGEWNDVGAYLAVRQGDAHSWVEYYHPTVGWVPIDPTPASDVAANAPKTSWLDSVADAARLTWTKWIIEYDLAAQIGVVTSMFSTLKPSGLMDESKKSDAPESNIDVRRTVFWIGVVIWMLLGFVAGRRRTFSVGVTLSIGIVATASTGWWLWFQDVSFISGSSGFGVFLFGFLVGYATRPVVDRSGLSEVFKQVEIAFAAAGLERKRDEGPQSFLFRASEQFPGLVELTHFETAYLRARFGSYTDIDRQSLETLAKRVKKRLGEISKSSKTKR